MRRLLALLLVPFALAAQALPEPPRAVPDITIPAATRTIRPTTAGALQAALDTARGGDEIVLANGATFVGNFWLGAHAGVVTLRSDTLPPLVRVDIGARLATITTPNTEAAISATNGAAGWRLVGLRVTLDLAPGIINYGIVRLGRGDELSLDAMPRDLVLDRVIVDAGETGWTSRCVALNGGASAVVRSQLRNCHGKGFDTQGVGGWGGTGPYLIHDNRIDGAGQNIMFGGGDPRIAGVTPSDITVTANHLYKPLGWAGRWTVKAAWELKHAQRVLVEGNVIEHHWIDAQTGVAVLYQTANQDCTAPWTVVRDVMMRGNVVRASTSGITVLAKYNQRACDAAVAPSERIAFVGNLFEGIGTDPITKATGGRFLQLYGDIRDAMVRGNTFTGDGAVGLLMLDGLPLQRLTLTGNAFGPTAYGIGASGMGPAAALAQLAPGAVITGNIFTGLPDWIYPAGNAYPAVMPDTGGADRVALTAMAARVVGGVEAPVVPVVAPPVVVTRPDTAVRLPDAPPVAVPPVVAPVRTCTDLPVGFAITTATSSRTERTVVTRAGVCVGVVVLHSATRYAAHRTCAAAPTIHTSRAAAVAAAATPCATGAKVPR
jgi:hypothetical protein